MSINNVISFLHFPIELLGAVIAYAVLLKKRNHFGLRLLGVICILLGIVTLFSFMDSSVTGMEYNALISYGVWCFAVFACMTFGTFFCFHTTWWEAIFCTTCAYLTEHIAYCIRTLLNYVTNSTIADAGMPVYYVIHISVYLICFFVISRHMIYENHYESSLMQSMWLLIFVLVIVIVLSIMSVVKSFLTIHAMYAFLCCGVILFSQTNQSKQIRLQKELAIKDQLWMKHNAQYEMSKENIDLINRKCHDLKHQIAALRTIQNLEHRDEVIHSIENSVMIYDSIVETENQILDTVLTEKSLICNANHIILTCISDGKILNFMDTVDLYTVFGNALDNGIESVMKLDEAQRHIGLLVHKKVGLIFIQFENPYIGEIQWMDGIPVSTKPDNGYHGFGIQSIKSIAEKYGGFITIETDSNVFVLRITIPVK